ncbi:MAG: hypothetical protein R3E66_00970 [bacterium]
MKTIFLLIVAATVTGCVTAPPRYESTAAWIDPQNGFVLVEVARPDSFVGCDTSNGDRDCRERRGYADYRTVVVDIEEGRISGEARSTLPTAPVLLGYPDLAPREFAARVSVLEVIGDATVAYQPYMPIPGAWLYWEPGRKRIGVVSKTQSFAATDVDELVALGADVESVRVIDRKDGRLRFAKQPRSMPGPFLMAPIEPALPKDIEAITVSPSGQHLAFAANADINVLDLDTNNRQTIPLVFPADVAFIDDETMLVVERNSDEPQTLMVMLDGTQVPLASMQVNLTQRVLLPNTTTVGFSQPDGIVFVSEDGGLAEFPPPVGPVSVDDQMVFLMYDDRESGDRVLIGFDMESGEEAELGRFDGYSTLLGSVDGTLVVYSPNPLLPGTVLYLVAEEIIEMHISTRLDGMPTTVFGPIVSKREE